MKLNPAIDFSGFLNINNNKPKHYSNWSSWTVTDIGKKRQLNEDSLLAKPESCLWAVADGMGGHKAGDVASQLIINSLNQLELKGSLEARIHVVKQCLECVNSKLQLYARQYEHHIVGSTVVVMVCVANYCAVIWAGDSRLYCLRSGKLQQLTQDHSASFGRGIITKAIGATESLEVDCSVFEIQEDDVFLLSSDGLDKEVSFTEIQHIMKTCKPQNIAKTLVNKTLDYGARDNVTVIVVNSPS